ncbi:beta-lactamase family protein [Belnapia sp. T6]|uniref:Beta-lactamase family protein n=1 Tax=Belnapia mucosa TaxID=2804532 RepID=A0ABS1V1N5_9PROT|nr:serine hydrolase domain-containing protein [Belnapia mucosa]MBL6455606.1 beta-lactamase family protein [Belnapia mucosa]
MPGFDRGAAAAQADASAAGWEAEAGPGGAILLFGRDGPFHASCGGLADLAQGLRITPDTAFRWASITKQVLASLVVREGPDLEETLGGHIPGLSPAVGSVTIGHALGMTSGLPDAMEAAWQTHVPPTTAMSRAMLFDFVARLPALNYAQGTEISYTNTGYRLLQHLMEARLGEMGEVWQDRYFRPLGMAGTRFPEDWTDPVPGLARGYWRDGQGRWHEGRYGPHFSASGGLAGSARDLAAWLAALLAGSGSLVGTLEALSAPRRLLDGRETAYGLGLGRSPLGGHRMFGHGGSLPGFKNHVLLSRELDAGVVVLTNREETDSLGLALSVMAAGLGLPPAPPPAAGLLGPGLYAAADGGPFWIEVTADAVSFLGTQERLYAGGDGWAVSCSPYMWIRLRQDGPAIEGEVNHAARRFLPVGEAACDPAWAGEWRHEEFGAAFRVAEDGGSIRMGAGPLQANMPLTPLGAGRAVFRRADGPWAQRPCLHFQGGTARIVSNRCRVLDFHRA